MRAMEKDRARRYQTMEELERDLERLLAGDQNVGLPPAVGPLAPAPAGPKRWPLVLVGAVVLTGGVAAALRRPAVAVRPVPSAPAGSPSVAVPALPTAPPSTAPPAPAPSAASPTAAAPAPARKVRVHAEHHPAKPPLTAPANAETSDAVKRGVLPSGSREAYPEK
jgi:hypothetical protein